jgi:hypothetical protein
VAEGHAGRGGDLVDHPAGVDVEELQPRVLAPAYVAIQQLVVVEERRLAAIVLGQSPAQAHGDADLIAHDPILVERVFGEPR